MLFLWLFLGVAVAITLILTVGYIIELWRELHD